MSYLVRKISRSKWNGCDANVADPLLSDAVTNCLKTTSNTLSVWYAPDEASIETAKLALLATLERFEAIDIIVIESNDVNKSDLPLLETSGDTQAKSLVSLHRDICVKTIDELKLAAKLVQAKVVANSVTRIMKGQFKDIIKRAVADKLILTEDLPERMAKELAAMK